MKYDDRGNVSLSLYGKFYDRDQGHLVLVQFNWCQFRSFGVSLGHLVSVQVI